MQRQAQDTDARIHAVSAYPLKYGRSFSWEKLTQTPWRDRNETKSKEEMKEWGRESPSPTFGPRMRVWGSAGFPGNVCLSSLLILSAVLAWMLCTSSCFCSFPFLLAEHRQECQKEFVSTRKVRCSLSASRPEQDYFFSCLVLRKQQSLFGAQ